MFCQHRLICCVHIQQHGVHQLLYGSYCSAAPRLPIFSCLSSLWMWCVPVFSLMTYTVYHIILHVQAFLMALFCLGWSLSVCISVWGYSGCPTGYFAFFPPHSISLVSPFLMELINATGALSSSSRWKILHCQCRISCSLPEQRKSGCQQGPTDHMKCWHSKSRRGKQEILTQHIAKKW